MQCIKPFFGDGQLREIEEPGAECLAMSKFILEQSLERPERCTVVIDSNYMQREFNFEISE